MAKGNKQAFVTPTNPPTAISQSNAARERQEFGLFSLIHGGWLGYVLAGAAIRHPIAAVLLAALAGCSAPLIAIFEGSFVNPELTLDIFHDIGWWNQFVLAFPTLLFLSGAYFGAFPHTLRQLVDSGVIKASDEQWKNLRASVQSRLKSRSNIMLPYLVGITGAILSATVLLGQGAWFSAEIYVAGWLIPLHVFFLYYFMTFLALRLVIVYFVLKSLFSLPINIQPFHEDGFGGLRSLEKQSGKLYAGFFALGLVAALGVISNFSNYGTELTSPYNLALLVAYFVMTTVAFFLPLYTTRKNMSAAKEELIASINKRYQKIHTSLESDRNGEGQYQALTSKDDLEALRLLRETANRMQVWPFNYRSLILFFASLSTPLIVIYLAVRVFSGA